MAKIMLEFTEKLELSKYIVYLMDYGAPIGLRMALKSPDKIAGLIVQNGNAYEEGLRDFWIPDQEVLERTLCRELQRAFSVGPRSCQVAVYGGSS